MFAEYFLSSFPPPLSRGQVAGIQMVLKIFVIPIFRFRQIERNQVTLKILVIPAPAFDEGRSRESKWILKTDGFRLAPASRAWPE